MEGGFVTLVLGAVLISLFTDGAPQGEGHRAALHAIMVASGAGLMASGTLRGVSLLMSLGLALLAVGLAARLSLHLRHEA